MILSALLFIIRWTGILIGIVAAAIGIITVIIGLFLIIIAMKLTGDEPK